MAAPTYVWHINNSTISTPDWNTILDAANDNIRFTGSGGEADPITAPVSNYMVANEMWFHDDDGIDYQCNMYQGGGQAGTYGSAPAWTINNSCDYIAIQATVNCESAAGSLTLWDDNNYNTLANEILTDPDWSGAADTCWLRTGQSADNVTHSATTATMPTNYDTQTDQTATYQIHGSGATLDASSALTTNNEHRYITHCFVPHNAGSGTSGHAWVYAYTYYYT